jgi:hypothetical protein
MDRFILTAYRLFNRNRAYVAEIPVRTLSTIEALDFFDDIGVRLAHDRRLAGK